MVYILLGVSVLLASLNLLQYRSRRRRSGQLADLAQQLSRQSGESSPRRLLLMTDDRGLRELLTALNRLLDASQETKAEFHRTERSMKKMLANLSHDLKTPLTVVLGCVEMIQSAGPVNPEEQERLLQRIHMKTQEIIQLMNRFFDLARLEAGDQDLPLTRIHINEVCRRSILSLYDLVLASGLETDIQIPDPPLYALGHEEALERVLQNLLSNAIRHGGDGRRIGLLLTSDENRIRIEVRDSGRGIPAHQQELIFERMYTLDESRNKAFQGSGLGLAITRKLVEEMTGEISLTSVPFEQTTFTVTLRRMAG